LSFYSIGKKQNSKAKRKEGCHEWTVWEKSEFARSIECSGSGTNTNIRIGSMWKDWTKQKEGIILFMEMVDPSHHTVAA
jgi:thymidylate synthase